MLAKSFRNQAEKLNELINVYRVVILLIRNTLKIRIRALNVVFCNSIASQNLHELLLQFINDECV